MLNLSQPLPVLRKQVKDYKGKNYFSLIFLDDIYPVRLSCDEAVYDQVSEGCEYTFSYGLTQYQGKQRVILIGAK